MNSEAFWTGIPGILTAIGGLLAAVGTFIGVLHTTGLLKRRGHGGDSAAPAVETEPTSPPSEHPPSGAPSSVPPAPLILRSAPAVVSRKKMSAMVVRRDFFDQRRNPSGSSPAAAYEKKVDGEMLMIVDASTGLTWEMGGSDRPMQFEEAPAHIHQLNSARAGGFADWRLPTAEEAMSLLSREAIDGFHLPVEFRRGQYFVWTADVTDDGSGAWVLYYADGTIAAESKEFNAWVRAVRSAA